MWHATHDRKRKKTPARGIHHRSSFLCHTREIGLLRKLRGLRAGCRSVQSRMSHCTPKTTELSGLTSATSVLVLISRS